MQFDNVEIREIIYQTKEYDRSLVLRDKILRKPLGLSLFDENLQREIDDWHLGAFQGEDLVGILILTKRDRGCVQMRQVAVDDFCRGMGIGSRLVSFSEKFAQSRGIKKIVLHARKAAIAFYDKMGYMTIGDEFTEVGIVHRGMVKLL